MSLMNSIDSQIRRTSTAGARREIQRLSREVAAREPAIAAMSDDAIKEFAAELRRRVAGGAYLDDLLVDAFALVREAAQRTIGQRPYDVQVMGGIALHRGAIAEMKTGEGKTLAATMPAFLNALSGRGVHVVTVNDYLARRDAEWMTPIYRFLGLTVGTIGGNDELDRRREAYRADITYAVHTELAFDYLKDNMRMSLDDMVQRELEFAILDEVDSVLIDEARMPIEIMSVNAEAPTACYDVDKVVRLLEDEYLDIDEKRRRVQLTDRGLDRVEVLLKEAGLIKSGHLYDFDNVVFVHLVNQALQAHKILRRDKDYVIKDGDVVLVDELRGRMLSGRRLGDGQHEALEAKEGLPLRKQGTVVAQTSYQNFFRLYRKLAGMTGTATMDAQEYKQIYGLSVVEIPTNRPMIRKDLEDQVFRSEAEKVAAVIQRVLQARDRRQPVLVGTTSVGKSEALSEELTKHGVDHEVLNARQHDREAEIIAEAGRPGAVTIATNMAGRGTDIQLGGNLGYRLERELKGIEDPEVIRERTDAVTRDVEKAREEVRQVGGLLILGTERFYCRRIDDQLIGRAGRQGDPGESIFMLSLDDDLIRVFGGTDKLKKRLAKIGVEKGAPMFHAWLTSAIRKAQDSLEEMFIESRMHVLDYDDVVHQQRKLVYDLRRELMTADNLDDRLDHMRIEVGEEVVERHMPPEAYPEQWDMARLEAEVLDLFNLIIPAAAWAAEEGFASDEMRDRLAERTSVVWRDRYAAFPPGEIRKNIRYIVLTTLDEAWRQHIAALEHLRLGIPLRGYAHAVPLQEYRREAYDFLEQTLERFRDNVVRAVSRMVPVLDAPPPVPAGPADPTFTVMHVKRLQACPCGSGRRYKDCHGRIAEEAGSAVAAGG
jgi:preprotein translocase subunit SecA